MTDPQARTAHAEKWMRQHKDILPGPLSESDWDQIRELLVAYAEARNEALLQAVKRYGHHEVIGGVGCCAAFDDKPCSCGFDEILDSGSASQEAKTPGGDVFDLDLLRELSDPADEYEGKNPPFGGGRLYSANQVRAMLTGFAGQMLVKYRFVAKGKEK